MRRRTWSSAAGRRCLLLAALAAGCGWVPADEQVLTRFFEQSRLYDTTRVAGFATVIFDPRVEGVVDHFAITRRVDHPLAGNRVEREASLATHVRSSGGEFDRTLSVTMERSGEGRWMVTGFRWVS